MPLVSRLGNNFIATIHAENNGTNGLVPRDKIEQRELDRKTNESTRTRRGCLIQVMYDTVKIKISELYFWLADKCSCEIFEMILCS